MVNAIDACAGGLTFVNGTVADSSVDGPIGQSASQRRKVKWQCEHQSAANSTFAMRYSPQVGIERRLCVTDVAQRWDPSVAFAMYSMQSDSTHEALRSSITV